MRAAKIFAVLALAPALMTAGCGSAAAVCDGKVGVCITMHVVGNATGLDQLSVSVDNPAPKTLTDPNPAKAFSLPIDLAVVLPPSTTGTVNFAVDGLSGGNVIAHDSQKLALMSTGNAVTITLNTSNPQNDMGGGGDGPPVDMANGCMSGFQDNDHNGTCTPACTATTCTAAHQSCDDSSGTATCACATGYMTDASGACVWGTVPLDPTFQDTPAGSWTLIGGATINATAAGSLDPGELVVGKLSYCNMHGAATQQIAMPPYAVAEPLAIVASVEHDCQTVTGGPCNTSLAGGTNISIDGVANFVAPVKPFGTSTICLGERAYGGSFTLAVNPWDTVLCPIGQTIQLLVDHLAIVPAASCPAPGTIQNGDFEGVGNWTGSGSLAGGIIPGQGTGGSKAGHIGTMTACDDSRLTGTISVPASSVPNAALVFDYNGANGVSAQIFSPSNATSIGQITGNGAFQTAKMCVGEFAKGAVMPISFYLPVVTGVACSTITPHDFYFDNFHFVSDPTCPASNLVNDGGFERNDPSLPWNLNPVSQSGGANATARIDVTAADAHTGTRSLLLANGQVCNNVTATTSITIPKPTATAGPMLQFFYKAPVETQNSFSIIPGGALPATASYLPFTVCLDPYRAGEPFQIEFEVQGPGGTCANTFGQENFWIDDVTVTTDPSCPAN